MRAGKGYCLAEVTVKGREAHSAYPVAGHFGSVWRRAFDRAHRKDCRGTQSETHADFDPPYTTLNVGVVQGGTAKNVVAGACRFTLEWRPIPGQDPGRLLELLHAAIAEETAQITI